MTKTYLVPRGRASIPTALISLGLHLVYMEGTRTEPYYIDNIKKLISAKHKCRQNDVLIIKASDDKKSKHTVELVEFAKTDVVRRINEKQNINHVWVFFDKDMFEDFDEAHKMIEEMNTSKSNDVKNDDGFYFDLTTEITWHSCWSNPCFELWLLLYYLRYSGYSSNENAEAIIERIEKIPELKAIKFEYKKNKKDIHSLLISNGGDLETAISSAKKLHSKHKIESPSTGVYEFAEFIKPYME